MFEIKKLEFLVKDYGLNYKQQCYTKCYSGNWIVQTYSFFNESGCFTIHHLLQRDEIDFYYAKSFSNIRRELCEREINVYSFEKDIWERYQKKTFFKKEYFVWSRKKLFQTLVEVIKAQIIKYNQFFELIKI